MFSAESNSYTLPLGQTTSYYVSQLLVYQLLWVCAQRYNYQLSSVQHGHSLLFEATSEGNKDMVDRLVDTGADTNVATTKVAILRPKAVKGDLRTI